MSFLNKKNIRLFIKNGILELIKDIIIKDADNKDVMYIYSILNMLTKDEEVQKFANRADVKWIRFCSNILKKYMIPHYVAEKDANFSDLDSNQDGQSNNNNNGDEKDQFGKKNI